MAQPTKRILRRRLLVLLLAPLAGVGLAEGGLRLLLFRHVPGFESLTRSLREPGRYADLRRDDLYWKLLHLWTPPDQRQQWLEPMPLTGWTGQAIDPRTLVQADEAAIGERRPVLLYGDSFALCLTAPEFSWQELLQRTPEGRTNALVNFGTSAFGIDQSLLLLEATIGRFAARRPLVIFAIYLEESPDRALLGCRNFPKPRSELVDGELVIHPLEGSDAQRWWEEHPPRVASYLWRMLRSSDPHADDARVVALTRAILARMHRELESQGIEHLVLGFESAAMLENPDYHGWRGRSVRQSCAELGIHYLGSRAFLLAAADGNEERAARELFFADGPGAGHYNARGNIAVLGLFQQALRSRFASEDTSGVRDTLLRFETDPRDVQQRELYAVGAPAMLTFRGESVWHCMQEARTPGTKAELTLGLHPEREWPARLEWKIERPVRFVAQLGGWRSQEGEEEHEAVRLRILLDGREQCAIVLRPREPAQPLEIDLPAGTRFALEVGPVAGSARACWARFDRAAFK